MSTQPDSDRALAETSGRLSGNGARLLALAAVLYAIGAVLLIADVSTFAGLACVALATPPAIAGVAMVGSGLVGRRASQQKPFA